MQLKDSAKVRKNLREFRWFCLPMLVCSAVIAFASDNRSLSFLQRLAGFCVLCFILICLDGMIHRRILFDQEGITLYAMWGKLRVKHFSWSELQFVGPILLKPEGKRPEQSFLVCSKKPPFLQHSNSESYTVRGPYLLIEDIPENRAMLEPHYKGKALPFETARPNS